MMLVLAHNLRPTDMIEGGRMVTSVKIKVRQVRPMIPSATAPPYVIESTNVLLDTGMEFTVDGDIDDHGVRVIAFFDALHEQSWN